MQKISFPIALFLTLVFPIFGHAQVVSGSVSDENGESLIGVHVYELVSERGDVTNTSGYFAMKLDVAAPLLVFSYVGFKSDTLQLSLRRDTTVHIRLKAQQLETVIVSATRDDNVANTTKLGTVHLSLPQIKRLPSLGGEVDIMKALSLTPGVTNGNEGASGLFVRGGSPDQNLILLDGAVVYNPNHLFGFLSVFNPDAIKEVTLIKGNYPARYGGRLSSVLDIRMKEGNATTWKGEVGVGLITSRLTLEGPIVRNKVSLLVSGRSSYLGLLLLPTRASYKSGQSDNYLSYFMTDFNAKINIRLSDTEQLSLSAYTGNDKLKQFAQTFPIEESISAIGWGNITTTLRHHKALPAGVFWESTAGFTRFLYQFEQNGMLTSEADTLNFGTQYSSGLIDYIANSRLTFLWRKNHKIQVGLEGVRHQFTPQNGFVFFRNSEGETSQGRSDRRWGTSLATYVEDELEISSRLSANIGLRWSSLWIDDSFFKAWEPRASLRYNFNKFTAVKAGYGQTQQYVHLLSSSSLGLQNDIWAPSTSMVPPQRAHQWAAGFAHYFDRWDVDFSIEVFFKTMNNLADFGEGVSLQLSVTEPWEAIIENQGTGSARGLEFFLHKKTGKLNGMVAYTYARSLRQFSAINNGQPFEFKYDVPHQFSSAINWQLNKNWDASFVWVLRSGYPVSIPEAIVSAPPGGETLEGQAAPLFIYGDRGNYRLPAYHRADIAFNHTKINRWGKQRTWNLGVYNLYNRQNILYAHLVTAVVGIDNQGSTITKPKLQTRSLLPILPSVGYTLKF